MVVIRIEFFLILLITVALTVNVSMNPLVFAQTTKESITLDWNQILTLIGLSGLITAGGGVLFEFLSDRFRARGERKRIAIERKVGLYSALIFPLERMIENPQFTDGSEHPTKISQTRDDIDTLLKEKFYLVDAKSISNWLYFRNHWEELQYRQTSPEHEERAQKVVDIVIDLRNRLVLTYNDKLRKDYKERMDTEIEKIDPEQREKIVLESPDYD